MLTIELDKQTLDIEFAIECPECNHTALVTNAVDRHGEPMLRCTNGACKTVHFALWRGRIPIGNLSTTYRRTANEPAQRR